VKTNPQSVYRASKGHYCAAYSESVRSTAKTLAGFFALLLPAAPTSPSERETEPEDEAAGVSGGRFFLLAFCRKRAVFVQ